MSNGQALRLSVDSGGCHGFTYKFSISNSFNQDDIRLEDNLLVIDKESLNLVDGSQIDFKDELIGKAFSVIENPRAGSACGCGVSFDLK